MSSRERIDRRRLILGASAAWTLCLGSGGVRASARGPGALARALAGEPRDAPLGEHRRLVLIELAGGNDGLSTVVPFASDAYRRRRPTIGLRPDEVLRLDAERGLHPALATLHRLYRSGRAAIVEGVGYPSAVRSHFKAFDVWHAADPRGRLAGEGWIGRLCAALWPASASPELVVHIGPSPPYSLHSNRHPPTSFDAAANYRWLERGEAGVDELSRAAVPEEGTALGGRAGVLARLQVVAQRALESSQRIRRTVLSYETPVEYPRESLAASLREAAALAHSELDTRVISTRMGGFDTHAGQRDTHDDLMRRLDEALSAFLIDLNRSQRGRDTLVVAFSEFGRRMAENASAGTDHGKAGPLFVLGHAIAGGSYGRHPDLEHLDEGDPAFTTDFRRVYATVIERWFGGRARDVLGAGFEPLDFV